MSTDTLYGINPNEDITPLILRDALSECFYQAHCEDSGIDPNDRKINSEYCKSIVEKAFAETGGSFDQPTKDSLMKAMQWLKDFSRNFRDPSLIEKHANQILDLLNKLH